MMLEIFIKFKLGVNDRLVEALNLNVKLKILRVWEGEVETWGWYGINQWKFQEKNLKN